MKSFNVCVLGNSHSACFKTGWELVKEAFSGVEVVFYPFHGPNGGAEVFRGFQARKADKTLRVMDEPLNQKLKALSGTDGIIQTVGVDLFLFCGGVNAWHALDLRKFSSKASALALDNAVLHSNSFALLATLRTLTKAHVFMTHVPFSGNREGYSRQRITCYPAEIEALNKRVLAAHNAVLLPQPSRTLGRKRETLLGYCVGKYDRKIRGKDGESVQSVDDLVHMNAHYGALAWVEALAQAGISPVTDLLVLKEITEEMLAKGRKGRVFDGHVYQAL